MQQTERGHAQCRGCSLGDLARRAMDAQPTRRLRREQLGLLHTIANGDPRTLGRSPDSEQGPRMRWNRTHTEIHHLCAGLLDHQDTGHDHAAPGPPPGQTRINSGIVDHIVQRVGTDSSRVEADTREEGEAATETMKPRSIQQCNHRRVTAEEQRGPTPKSAGFPAAWCWRRERHQWAQVPGVFCERANTAAGRGTRAPAVSEWRRPNKARARPLDRRMLSGSASS